ncbi:MAG: M23 family metallopeptidase, partial [Clostridia bacterium]|nr:M23 family metallopeptidase [Clostridia bacterium]
MSNKNSSVIKLIGNKLFIALLVFAIAVILVSAVLNRNMQEFAQIDEEYKEEIPVVSEAEVYEETTKVEELPVIEKVEEVIAEDVKYTMPLTGELQKGFSSDELLWDETMQDWRTHNGIDIASDAGAEVDTAAEGTVVEAYESETYGFVVKVQHPDGIVTVYKNLERIVVEKDDTLDLG